MAKTKTSSAVKQRYNEKAYDRLSITIPKGRKAAVEAHAQSKGESINGLVNALLRADMGPVSYTHLTLPTIYTV